MRTFRPKLTVLPILAFGLLTTSVLTCGGSDKGAAPFTCTGTREQCINALAGTYQGTYTGDTSGTWSVEISADGMMTGSVHNTRIGRAYDLSGSADENGRMVFGNLSDGTEFQGSVAVDFTVSGTWKASGAKGAFTGGRTVALVGNGGTGGLGDTGGGGGVFGSAGAGGAGGTSSSACNPLAIRAAAEEPTCANYAATCSASADCLALGCCFGGCPLLAGPSRETCLGKCWKAYPAVAQTYFAACNCIDRHLGASECADGRPPVATGGTGGSISVPDAGVSSSSCGNGRLDSSETCDDANRASNDGCGATCTLEGGFICPVVGKPCQPLSNCGDGIVSPGETCDDGKTVAGDGCSGTCLVEPGYKCDGQPSVCTSTVCGDSVVEGGESCDDGNALSGDGCSQICQLEPSCTGATCKIRCGDGIIVTGEMCDDGNTTDGDGCSSQCSIEGGWTCTQIPSAISGYSKTSCQSNCGDGIAAGTEECDNGSANQDNGAACTTQCKWSRAE